MSGRRAAPSVGDRFRERIAGIDGGGRRVVAVSGGLDSCVLLHLLRFASAGSGQEVVAAHFDHRMRPCSEGDARWIAGLCRAWDVPIRVGRAAAALGSEEAAREARYEFLETVRGEVGATHVLTAHHADDQAETVLFRLLRGSGTRGLSGIPAHRGRTIFRPLLDFWRSELEAYAGDVLLSWREDPTNLDHRFARNALRQTILPDVERLVAPGARGALVRLAELASDEEAAWQSVLPGIMAPLEVTRVDGGVSFRRAPFVDLHPAVRMRALRALSAELGVALDHSATRRGVDFAEAGASGRAIDLCGALGLGVDLDRLVLARSMPPGEDEPVIIAGPDPGRGTAVLSGRPVRVTWGEAGALRHKDTLSLEPGALRFPLIVRSRRPGDRIRLPGGTKKVKKVLLERRIPPSERHRIAMVADARGEVLWIPGLARAEGAGYADGPRALCIGVG